MIILIITLLAVVNSNNYRHETPKILAKYSCTSAPGYPLSQTGLRNLFTNSKLRQSSLQSSVAYISDELQNSAGFAIDTLEYQLHNLSKQIYSTISQEEIDFLALGAPTYSLRVYTTYYLTEKYINKFDKIIENTIPDSSISNLQNTSTFQSTKKITLKQALTFAYLSFLIQKKDIILEDVIRHANMLCVFYQNIDVLSLKSKFINCKFCDAGIETNIIKRFGTISTEIINSLTSNDIKFLSEASDTFILAWLFAKRWVFLVDDYEYVSKIVNEEFIDNEMLKYLTKKYNLLLVRADEFRFLLASAYAIGKLKKCDKTIDDCVRMFETFDNLVKPKPSGILNETTPELPTDCETSGDEVGRQND